MVKRKSAVIGIFFIILLILFLVFLYFEIKKVEYSLTELEKAIVLVQTKVKQSSSTPLSKNNKIPNVPESLSTSSLPKSEFIFPKSQVKKFVHLPILMYHHIDYLSPRASRAWRALTVSPPTFEKQMKYLFEQNYQPITFRQFLNLVKTSQEFPKNLLIITFDDGWRNQYLHAFPVLKKYNFPATFFIVTNQIGGNRFMNKKQLKKLLNSGIEIGSHTISHPNLGKLNSSQVMKEIKNSKIFLKKKLNCEIKVFAYPYGIFDSRIMKIVRKSGYKAARTTLEGVNQNIQNMYNLRAIQIYDDLSQLKSIFPSTE